MSKNTDDVVFHFPPDFLSAVVDAVPLLTRGRYDVITFFQGCGVSREFLKSVSAKIAADPKYSKYHATREILTHLNEIGDRGLAARRQVVQRVSQWEDFSTCYPDNQLKARGAVATVAQLVNQKDSFTRMNIERERAQEQHRKEREAELTELQRRRAELASVKDDLFGLYSEQNPRRRGKALEAVLNRLFAASGITVREAFEVRGEGEDHGIVEQIDGAIELRNQLYLVEMKWWKEALGRTDVSSHLVSVYGRNAGGVFISASGYHDSAIAEFKTALAQRTVIMVELEEIVIALSMDHPIEDLLNDKVQAATLTRQPLVYPLGKPS
jgi:hypothetical protein